MNRLKILNFDEGFLLYYFRLKNSRFKWPLTKEEAIKVTKEDLSWLLKGYEIRTTTRFLASFSLQSWGWKDNYLYSYV